MRTLDEPAHPDRRMDVCEVVEELEMRLLDVACERERLVQSPLVLEEAAHTQTAALSSAAAESRLAGAL